MKWVLCRVFPLLLAIAAFALPHDSNDQAAFRVQEASEDLFIQWELPPNPNSTHHLIFNSVSGLLQRWPNTFRRNGHSIVPATISTGTILYHGRANNSVPDAPDWLAFDFEHAHMLCFGPCYMISVQAKRDLRLLYFDGSSAAKMKGGSMDSQDLIIWGKPRPDKFISELERIKALCDWGKPFGLDGFVRMEFHFEVMICDFSDGLEVITLLDLLPFNVTKGHRRPPGQLPHLPFPDPAPSPPPGWRGSLLDYFNTFFEAHVAGGWHDHAPGETRVHLDYTGFVTFYDPTLSSLVEARQVKDRFYHRLEGISAADTKRVHAELQSMLTRKKASGSNIDWGSIARIMMERYADRLEYLRYLLSPNATFTDAAEQAAAARTQLLIMLAPYLTTVDVPEQRPATANVSWAAPAVRRCATTQTSHIPLGMLTPQEVRIHAAVEGTLREICRRLMLVWLEFFDVEGSDEAKAVKVIDVGHRHIDELMSWLDWSLWVRCEPACGLGENCYLPSWPFFTGEDPYDMTPRCISPKDIIH
ncbi:hypothetical protein BJV74DRAFT_775079 [Russula compacta]|nr:hypothetical protein BJV74DRAFT_775079 [Russula compacta]